MAEAGAARASGPLIAYLKLFRLPLVFTAIADSLAGSMFVWGAQGARWAHYACLALASAGLYAFGMAMNDVADREEDRRSAPGRPIPSGRISLRGALVASFAALGLSAAGMALNPAANAWSWGAWGAAVAAILAYDFVLKVPPVMGSIRAFNYLIGALSFVPVEASGQWRDNYLWPGLAFLVYGTSLTFVSRQEDGAVRRGALWLGTAGLVAGALLPSVTRLPGGWHGLGPAGLLVLWILWRASRAADKKGVMLMVRDGVAGFILLDASIVARYPDPVAALAIAALLVPAFGLVAVFKRLA